MRALVKGRLVRSAPAIVVEATYAPSEAARERLIDLLVDLCSDCATAHESGHVTPIRIGGHAVQPKDEG